MFCRHLFFSLLLGGFACAPAMAQTVIAGPSGQVNLAQGEEVIVTGGGSITNPGVDAITAANPINDNTVRMFGTIITNTANDDGIDLNNNGTVVLGGSISTSGGNSEGIVVLADGIVVIQSSGTITTTANSSDGVRAGNRAEITHNGTITAGSEAIRVANFARIFGSGTLNARLDGVLANNDLFLNMQGASINTTADAGEGIFANDNAVVVFQGDIVTLGNNAEGIELDNDASLTLGAGSTVTTSGSGAEALQVGNDGTVIVGSGAALTTSGPNAEGIVAEARATIRSGATIVTTGNNQAHGIAAGGNADIINTGSITVSGVSLNNNTSPNGIRAGNGSIVDNRGQIRTAGGHPNTNTNNGAHGIRLGTNGTALNSGTITTTGDYAMAIFTGNGATIFNSGRLETGGDNRAFGVLTGNNGSITNTGDILTRGSRTNGNRAPNGVRGGNNVQVVNTGSITTLGTNAANAAESAHAVRLGNNASLDNSGSIRTSGADADGVFAGNNMVLNNSGSIIANAASANGVDLANNATVTNSGAIRAGGIGVSFLRGNGTRRLTNSGRIETTIPVTNSAATTGYAIRFRENNSNDILTLQSGSRIIGRIDMGNQGGNDTIILDRSGGDIAWRWTFEDVNDLGNDTLTVLGGPFIVERTGDSLGTGITVTVADTRLQTGAGAALADLAGAQARLTLNRISEAWALSDAPALEDREEPRRNAWIRSYGGLRYREGSNSPSGDTADSQNHWFGIAAGADIAVGQRGFVGAYVSQTHSRTDFAGTTQVVRADTTSAGLYGRFESAFGLFADASLIAGYVDGDGGLRERANNLVAGGIEEIAGGDTSGAYMAPTMRLGANIRLTEGFALVPSATLGYAAQWREAYQESATAGVFQTADAQLVETGTARLELAANITRNAAQARFFGGVDLRQDLSGATDITLESPTIGSTNFTIDPAAEGLEVGGFAGMAFHWAMGEHWALNLDAEASLAELPESFDPDILDEVGFDASAGFRMRF